jgi:mono/diheme cytochrome c family protein
MRRLAALALALMPLLPLLAACSAEETDPQTTLVKRGKVVFDTNCIACHAADPRRDGALGPANACASAELLAAKVLRNEYPPGYTPKRDTQAMAPLPHLEPELPALTAYLQSLGCD